MDYPHDTASAAARGWPSTERVPHMVQQAPGVWVRTVHCAQSVFDEITARLVAQGDRP